MKKRSGFSFAYARWLSFALCSYMPLDRPGAIRTIIVYDDL